jgi:hypothetical protein
MKIPMMFAVLIWAAGCATVQNSTNSPSETAPDQVMVEVKFKDVDDMLSAPRIITISGREARIETGESTAVPGQVEQVQSGILLTILPEIRDTKIVFHGSCQVKQGAGRSDRSNLKMVAFHSREAFFEGVANSGEIKRVEIESPNGDRLIVTLKFTVVVNLPQRLSSR